MKSIWFVLAELSSVLTIGKHLKNVMTYLFFGIYFRGVELDVARYRGQRLLDPGEKDARCWLH